MILVIKYEKALCKQDKHCIRVWIGMLDLIITSYKLIMNVSSYLQKYIDYTYNVCMYVFIKDS